MDAAQVIMGDIHLQVILNTVSALCGSILFVGFLVAFLAEWERFELLPRNRSLDNGVSKYIGASSVRLRLALGVMALGLHSVLSEPYWAARWYLRHNHGEQIAGKLDPWIWLPSVGQACFVIGAVLIFSAYLSWHDMAWRYLWWIIAAAAAWQLGVAIALIQYAYGVS